MGWTASKFMPCLLRDRQTEDHVNKCQELQEGLEIDPETKERSSCTNNVNMGWTASKSVPCLLSERQKEDRVNVHQ